MENCLRSSFFLRVSIVFSDAMGGACSVSLPPPVRVPRPAVAGGGVDENADIGLQLGPVPRQTCAVEIHVFLISCAGEISLQKRLKTFKYPTR